MPRYYRRRYTRVVRPKKKWASNIALWNNSSLSSSFSTTLVANSAQAASPTPSILKVGNFKMSADIVFKLNAAIGVENYNPASVGYIIYVPEGWEDTSTAYDNLIVKHPEWIMATKTLGSSVTGSGSVFNVETINVSTRLKRNLNSGDKVAFYLKLNSYVPQEGLPAMLESMKITGTCRYWTCSN